LFPFLPSLQPGPVFLIQDIPHTAFGPAIAPVILIFIKIIPVIIRELFPRLNIFNRNDPNMPPDILGFTVGLARVINEPGRIIRDITVQILFFI